MSSNTYIFSFGVCDNVSFYGSFYSSLLVDFDKTLGRENGCHSSQGCYIGGFVFITFWAIKVSELYLPPSAVDFAEHGEHSTSHAERTCLSIESSDMHWNQWPIKHLLLLFKAYSSFAKSLLVQDVVTEPRSRIPVPPETQARMATCVPLFSRSVLLESLA